jgi:hypothetical protein
LGWGGGGEGGRENSQDPPSTEKLRMRSAAFCTPPTHPHKKKGKKKDKKNFCHFLLKKNILKFSYPYTFFEIPLSKKIRYPDHTTYRGLIKHC